MALPLTLIVITGEIDLSVAVDARAHRRRHGGARSSTAGRSGSRWSQRSSLGALCGAFNGFLVTRLGPAVARGHDRHADAVPRDRAGDPARPTRSAASRTASRTSASSRSPARRSRTRSRSSRVLAVVFGVVLHATPLGPCDLRDRRRPGGSVLRGHPREADQVLALRPLGLPERFRRHPLDAPVRLARATTRAPGWSCTSSRSCCSAASRSSAGAARSSASCSPSAVLGCLQTALTLDARLGAGSEHRRRRPADRERDPAEPSGDLYRRARGAAARARPRRRQRAARRRRWSPR